ncbi:hypothetical protein EVAR_9986_1 [Eumeta japonica]|uniref:Uncharacterized protein n=1 Tax=Eumeta variegata TaxID=151549 RepID=A0A4C1TR59_EUMVA|nr:hypothetical protein EVAR_9986_1 [Eumeta japonica]
MFYRIRLHTDYETTQCDNVDYHSLWTTTLRLLWRRSGAGRAGFGRAQEEINNKIRFLDLEDFTGYTNVLDLSQGRERPSSSAGAETKEKVTSHAVAAANTTRTGTARATSRRVNKLLPAAAGREAPRCRRRPRARGGGRAAPCGARPATKTTAGSGPAL